jgi:ABC-type multidrug transport system ATPase subunit
MKDTPEAKSQKPVASSQGPEASSQKPEALSITLKGLSKRFNREWIFRNLDFSFYPGTYAITGPNGSGKSTLLQVVWGQVPQTSGEILYKKGDVDIPGEEIFQYLTIATPYMDLIEEFTLREQLQFHFSVRESRGLSIEAMMEKMYLTASRDKYISNFSSGMRQRVKLAMAFYTQADIIILDEPGTNLDHQAFEWYRSELAELPPGTLILIASNDPSEYPPDAQKIDIMHYK